MQKKRVLVIDDDPLMRQLLERVLTQAGYAVETRGPDPDVHGMILRTKPDLVVIDIMMPGLDGLEVLRRLKSEAAGSAIKVAVCSAKSFDYDRRLATGLGADAYITKPVDPASLASTVAALIAPTVAVRFWGVRGTLPVSRPDSVRYGGNTSCVTLTLPDQSRMIFDAGSGIFDLGTELAKAVPAPERHSIFISHPHWDHINAFPYFAPLYRPGVKVDVYGPECQGIGIDRIIKDQMGGVYFPITARELRANLHFHSLSEQSLTVGRCRVSTMFLNHPGVCLGYRIEAADLTVVYATDNELTAAAVTPGSTDERFAALIANADILITDTTYTEDEYRQKIGWGHSSVERVVRIAAQAGVRSLCLFHHDPSQNDAMIDHKMALAGKTLMESGAAMRLLAPRQGTRLDLSGSGIRQVDATA